MRILTERFEHEGQPVLGISSLRSLNVFAKARFGLLTSLKGTIVAGGTIRDWNISGIAERSGIVFLCGDDFEGETLTDILVSDGVPVEKKIAAVRAVAEAEVVRFPGAGGPVPVLMPHGVLVGEAVLFLSETMVERLFRVDLRFQHPDLSGAAAVSWTFAALMYAALCGKSPATGLSDDELSETAREKAWEPIALVNPRLKPEIRDFITAALRGETLAGPEVWLSKIDSWNRDGYSGNISANQEKTLRDSAEKSYGSTARKIRTKKFWNRNKLVFAIVLAVAVGAAAFVNSSVRNERKFDYLISMPSRDIVETFYRSYNLLDHEVMSRCVTGGAGAGEINSALTLYSFSRVREGMENKKTFVDAEDWIKKGKPTLAPDMNVFGITDLKIEAVTAHQDEASFNVEYTRWSTIRDDKSGRQIESEPVRQELTLKNLKKGWKISAFKALP